MPAGPHPRAVAHEPRAALPPLGFLALCARSPEVCHDSSAQGDPDQIEQMARRLSAELGGHRKTSKPAALKPRSIWSADNWAGFFKGADTVVSLAESGNVPATRAAVTPELWATLYKVNDYVNKRILSRSDWQIFGQSDYWALPFQQQGQPMGDCEDFVLQKRQLLIARGIAPSALSIAVVRIGEDSLHAVLLVETDGGIYVLDSLSPRIAEANAVRYEWLERQVAGEAFQWTFGPPDLPTT